MPKSNLFLEELYDEHIKGFIKGRCADLAGDVEKRDDMKTYAERAAELESGLHKALKELNDSLAYDFDEFTSLTRVNQNIYTESGYLAGLKDALWLYGRIF